MLFGRAAPNEAIEIHKLETYLDRCFDTEVRRLSTRMPQIENELVRSFTGFGDSIKKFSEREGRPNMEYLYGIKESYLASQKPNYTSHILRITSARPAQGGANIYIAAQNALTSYKQIITEVLKANNTFKLVIMAYAEDLKAAKRNFNAMEKLSGELSAELSLCSGKFGEYTRIKEKVGNLLYDLSQLDSLGKMQPDQAEDHQRESAQQDLSGLSSRVGELAPKLESAKDRRREIHSNIVNALLPLERIARKHDHMSSSKRKLSDYVGNPAGSITGPSDLEELRGQIGNIIEEINTGKITVKNPDRVISQLKAAETTDFLALAVSLHGAESEVMRVERELEAAKAERSKIERAEEEERLAIQRRADSKKGLTDLRASVASQKAEIERLFREVYKKQVEIKFPV
ncbi:MAG: hypothetical protein KGH94_00645 [Candidatus Micrarchaeota archaeon]|nr:hypothetical protein [Candidatus Micrarchaeota archaeon]